MSKKIQFHASIPPLQTAIATGGDGARIKLDIPEMDIQAVAALMALKSTPLIVTIEIDDGKGTEQKPESGNGRPWLRKRGKADA